MFRTERTDFEMSHQETEHWRPRDYLAAALLFVATAGFVAWQNSRVAVLWDLGYLLDTSWRIAVGQMPYRDFPLAHAPLTYLIQAGLIQVGGRHYAMQIAYAAIAGGVGTLLAWRILLRIVRPANIWGTANWFVALVLAAPLAVLGIYSVYPHPIYDSDCTLAILFAILLLSRVSAHDVTPFGKTVVTPLAAGAVTVLPVFFKQNIGLPFLACVAVGMLLVLAADLVRTRSLRDALRSQPALVLAGMILALLAALATIIGTAGLANYVHWTMQFAVQRRMPGLASMLSVYQQPSFAWTLPTFAAGLTLCHTRFLGQLWARIAAICLVAAPFAGSLIFLVLNDDSEDRADNFLALWPLLLLAALFIAVFELRRGITPGRLLPFFLLAAIHGTLLSQQLWGSTYALWPLLLVLVACMLAALPRPARPVAIAGAVAISATFLMCGWAYSASLERLNYIHIPEALLQRSTFPPLRGMVTPGEFLPNFDELVAFAAREIPSGDALLLLPGEDPFYYATGRTPQFPVTLFDPATDPYSASGLLDEARRRDVRWVIVKRALQINENALPESDQTMRLVQQDFALYARLRGYEVYRRK